MKQFALLSLTLLLSILFLGCSSKKVYKPDSIEARVSTTSCPSVVDLSGAGATLSNGTYISTASEGKIPQRGYKFVNDNQKPIFVNNDASLIVGEKMVDFDERIITASLFGDKLAFVTQSNRFGIYDIHKESYEFQHVDSPVNTLNIRTVAPIKIDDIIIFATLNGKLMVVSNNQLVREIVITPRSEFNNPIFLGVLSNTLIAATATDIIALGGNMMERMKASVADIVIANDYLYIFTKDGKVQKYDERLTLITERSFQFANFIQASSVDSKLYVIEKAGYVLEFDKELDYKVFNLRDNIEGFSFLKENTLYYGGRCYNL